MFAVGGQSLVLPVPGLSSFLLLVNNTGNTEDSSSATPKKTVVSAAQKHFSFPKEWCPDDSFHAVHGCGNGVSFDRLFYGMPSSAAFDEVSGHAAWAFPWIFSRRKVSR
jgi:hypothetical protein